MKTKLADTADQVQTLDSNFKNFANDTNEAILDMRKSLEKVQGARKQTSVVGSNIFDQLKQTKDERSKLVFGKRARGVWNDASLKSVETLIE